jgi:ribosomal-protein-alanine N-acetyltransferase
MPNPIENLFVRPAKCGDIAAILEIEQRGISAAHWPEARYREALEKEPSSRLVLVVEANSSIYGFGIIHILLEECELENIAVEDSARGVGLGTQLMKALLESALNRGASSLFLEVRESNQPAIALYNRVGMEVTGRRKGYYQNPVEDAILYRIYLRGGTLPGGVE